MHPEGLRVTADSEPKDGGAVAPASKADIHYSSGGHPSAGARSHLPFTWPFQRRRADPWQAAAPQANQTQQYTLEKAVRVPVTQRASFSSTLPPNSAISHMIIGYATLYLRAAVHRRCQLAPKGLGTSW